MLQITVIVSEMYDEETNEFIVKKQTLQLEHSLISLSKWESKWCKPFLSTNNKTDEEIIDYIKCMTLTSNVNPDAYYNLSSENVTQINDYINAPMTATTFNNEQKTTNREIITAELIYYWMIIYGIPFEICQKWHLNRLLTLIRVCIVKNTPTKKMSKRDIMSQNASLNAARRAKLNSKG